MAWEAEPSGRRGRQQAYSDAAIQACLALKVLFGLPLRQTTGFVESLLKLVGSYCSVPDFSTLCRRQRTSSITMPYKVSAGPMHPLIDSMGIKAESEGEWNARKHGGSKRRLWRKIHLGIDEETLEIRAIEVSSSEIGDVPFVEQTVPPDCSLILLIARPTQSDPARSGDRQRHRRWCLRHPQMRRCDRSPKCPCRHTAT